MRNFIRFLRDAEEVLVTAGAVVAAAIVVVETLQVLRDKVESTKHAQPRLPEET